MTENAIRPFTVAIPQSDVDDLRDRLARTRWPAESPEGGWSRGVPLEYLKVLAAYWADGFDWRAEEAALNAMPQFVTEIEGQRIHFIHVRSSVPGATPLMLTHGWPSSPVEFLNVVEPLTNPEVPEEAFHVVIPSLPGYGFSTPMTDGSWGNIFRVAGAWAQLMDLLGYDRYAVHGTDVGSGVAGLLAMLAPDRVVGVHLTGTSAGFPFGPPLELEGLAPADREKAERFNRMLQDGFGYLQLQATRPQTLAYSLTDSPVGQLAWIVEKYREWTDPRAELPEDAVDRDQMLTNVSVNWFMRAGASSAHAGYEGMKVFREMMSGAHGGGHFTPPPMRTGYAVFAADNTIRSIAERTGPIAHWSEFDRGGHFPAMEVPDLLVDDLRTFFHRTA